MFNLQLIGISLRVIVFTSLYFTSMWALFNKMGERGINSLFPVWNSYFIFKKMWKTGWFPIFAVLSGINMIGRIFVYNAHAFTLYGLLFEIGTFSAGYGVAGNKAMDILRIASLTATVLGTIMGGVLSYYTGKAFRKSSLFILGMILLPEIFYIMLVFSAGSKYYGNYCIDKTQGSAIPELLEEAIANSDEIKKREEEEKKNSGEVKISTDAPLKEDDFDKIYSEQISNEEMGRMDEIITSYEPFEETENPDNTDNI